MEWSSSLTGMAEQLVRKYIIGDDVVNGQIVCYTGLGGNGLVGDPASVNDYTEAIGICQNASNLTYATAQGSGGVLAECT